jgi:site-specific DNA recombinase
VEPIISEELWTTCNNILDGRKDNRPGPKPVQLFAGLLYCGCGENNKMYVFSRSPKYVCPKCRNKIAISDIDQIIQDELADFFVSKDRVREHLAEASESLKAKRENLASHERQIAKIQTEMRKTYQLFQADQLSPEGFGKIYRPLEEQERALTLELPKLQGELDALEMHQLSADEVVSEASNLHRMWPKLNHDERRNIIESIIEKIILNGEEIAVTYCCMPSSEELTKRQRHLSDSSPRSA